MFQAAFPIWELDFSVGPFPSHLRSFQYGSPVAVLCMCVWGGSGVVAPPQVPSLLALPDSSMALGLIEYPSPSFDFQHSGFPRPCLSPPGSSVFLDPSLLPWILAAGSALTTSPEACLWHPRAWFPPRIALPASP